MLLHSAAAAALPLLHSQACVPSLHPPPPPLPPPPLPQLVKLLGLEKICAGPTASWSPLKQHLQVYQGISALVARLDFGGRIQYGNGSENSLCNWFKDAPRKDGWNW